MRSRGGRSSARSPTSQARRTRGGPTRARSRRRAQALHCLQVAHHGRTRVCVLAFRAVRARNAGVCLHVRTAGACVWKLGSSARAFGGRLALLAALSLSWVGAVRSVWLTARVLPARKEEDGERSASVESERKYAPDFRRGLGGRGLERDWWGCREVGERVERMTEREAREGKEHARGSSAG